MNRALEYYEEALAIERELSGNNSMSVARALNHIGNVYLQKGDVDKLMATYSEALRIYHAKGKDSIDLIIAGYNFYCLSKLHPECAAVA